MLSLCLNYMYKLCRYFFRSGCCQTSSGGSEKSSESLVPDVWQKRKVELIAGARRLAAAKNRIIGHHFDSHTHAHMQL